MRLPETTTQGSIDISTIINAGWKETDKELEDTKYNFRKGNWVLRQEDNSSDWTIEAHWTVDIKEEFKWREYTGPIRTLDQLKWIEKMLGVETREEIAEKLFTLESLTNMNWSKIYCTKPGFDRYRKSKIEMYVDQSQRNYIYLLNKNGKNKPVQFSGVIKSKEHFDKAFQLIKG